MKCTLFGFAKSVLSAAATVVGVGCTERIDFEALAYRDYKVDQDLSGVVVPKSIWPVIAGDGSGPQESHEHPAHEGVAAGAHGVEKPSPARLIELKPLRVWLVELEPGILGGVNHRFDFGPGGGVLDLSDLVVEGSRGVFSLGAQFESDNPRVLSRSVLFVSNSRRRQSGAQIWGSGCRAFFDISSFFEVEMSKRGFLFSADGNAHASALAGTFLFVARTPETDLVAQVTFKDSRTRFLQCRP